LTFGGLLRQHRLAAGLSQETPAERAGLSARASSDLKRGLKRASRRDTVALLAGALGLTPDERAVLEGTMARVTSRIVGKSGKEVDGNGHRVVLV